MADNDTGVKLIAAQLMENIMHENGQMLEWRDSEKDGADKVYDKHLARYVKLVASYDATMAKYSAIRKAEELIEDSEEMEDATRKSGKRRKRKPKNPLEAELERMGR